MNERRTQLPNPRLQPRFGGICTFGRYPRLEDVESEARPIDWLVYGVPYDSGVTYRPGTRFGPRAIRAESQYLKHYSMPHDVDVPEVLSLADAGDAPVEPYDCRGTLDAVAGFARALPDPTHTKLLAIGGDHSIAYANMRATFERRGGEALAAVHFDTHLDTVDAVWGERWGHASPFVRAIEDGLIDPKRMISIGIKGPLNSKDDLAYARDHGITIVSQDDLDAGEGEAAIRGFLDRTAGSATYATFDVDCIDPAYAPGTGTPCPGGLTPREAFALLRRMRGASIVGADIVEVLPERDPGGYTALLAAHVAFEILCLDAAQRGPAE
ncbi:MAG: agmatinase [Planctomycetota bacterium]